jgi:NitT/TauT family transport system permease protein
LAAGAGGMSAATFELELAQRNRTSRWLRLARLRRLLLGGGVIIGFLLVWEILCQNGTIRPSFAAAPSKIAPTLGGFLVDPSFWSTHLAATASGFVAGWLLAVAVGLALGFLMGWYLPVRDTLEPFIVGFYSTPRIALIPLFIVWFGFGFQYKLVVVFMAAFFPVLLNTMAGVRNPDAQLVTMARSYGATDRQLLRTVVLPGAVPYILTGLRQSVVQGLLGAVVGEIFSSQAGLGYIINRASQLQQVDRLFAAVTMLSISGATLNELLLRLERRFQRWQPDAARI